MKVLNLAALTASLAAAGCSQTLPPPDQSAVLLSANPALGVRNIHHHPVVNYVHRTPAEPKNWRQSNDDLSPARRVILPTESATEGGGA